MIKKRRLIGSILALSLIINILLPAAGAFAANEGEVKAKSKLQGVTYTMRPDVITMPQGITYELEEEEVLTTTDESDTESIESMALRKGTKASTSDIETKRTKKTIPTKGRVVRSIEEEPRWNMVKDYIPKSITVDSNTSKSLSPRIGTIYYDEANQSVMKVTGSSTTDVLGMTTIPVEQPEISELIENLNIPEQTIPLSNDCISYVNEEVSMMTDIYSQSTDDIESFSTSGRKPMVEIDLSGLDLIDESTDKDHEEEYKAKLKAIDDNPNLNGYAKAQAKEKLKEEEEALEKERESELKYKAKVEITEGTLKIYEPTLTAYAKWGFWGDFKSEASANIDVESDLLIDGDLNISKQVEILIYGYDIDFEIGKFYAGVYLVLGLNGQIDFQIRVQQEGTVRVGVKAVGWLIPMAAYPVVEYNSKKFETAITASGELKLWAHAMPKAGIELFNIKVLSASFRVGLEANVKLELSSASQSVRLWIDMILQLNAVVFGCNIDILDKRFNMYDRTWSHTEGESIGGGTDIKVKQACAYLNLEKVDAMRDIISGTAFRSIVRNKDLVPCSGEDVRIYISHADGTKTDKYVKVNSKGEFVLNTPISPLDRVGAFYSRKDQQYEYKAEIPLTNVQPPYTVTYLFPDAFNSRITGEINGEKYGPDGIALNGDEVKFTKPIDIIIEKPDGSKKSYKVTPNTKGEFALENVELYKGDKILSQLVFEDAKVISEAKNPELGLEIYLDVKKDDENNVISISGAIQNMYGSEPYLGDVYLVGAGSKENSVRKAMEVDDAFGLSQTTSQTTTKGGRVIKGKSSTKQTLDRFKLNIKDNNNTIPIKAFDDFFEGFGDPLNTSIGSTTPGRMNVKNSSSPSSVFEFKDVEYVKLNGVGIRIEHNGVTIYKSIIPAAKMPETPTLEKAVVSPVEAYIEQRINYGYNKDMKSAINKQQRVLQNAMQTETPNVNFTQNNGISYTMSMVSPPPSNGPKEYSFSEGDIKLVAKAGAGSITLTWNELKEGADIKGYNIYRGIKPDGEDLTPITGTPLSSPRYVDKNVKAGVQYYYLCSVVYENGDEFIISNEASAKPRISKR
ncbi:MAG: hypothetical protein EWM47_11520 [Anaerolineaceae bacterium]|nr:MAG: hypothetical protein EWM47_11520 [Anaerolineaceae bacterium]